MYSINEYILVITKSELYVHFQSPPGLLSASVYTWIQRSNGQIVLPLSSVHLLGKESTPARIQPNLSYHLDLLSLTLHDTSAQWREFLHNIFSTKYFSSLYSTLQNIIPGHEVMNEGK